MTPLTTFRKKNRNLAEKAVVILKTERPMTLRQLFYRCVSAGLIANSQKEYDRLGGVMTRLREAGAVPRTWIVDHVRSTLKPSSWSGLQDFGETVRNSYRLDFWASLDHHVEVFVEKDAVAGTIQPVTAEYDVALRVCRGYSSVSFAGEISDEWRRIEKKIYALYLGDFDPSGFDLERDLREKLERYAGKRIHVYDPRDPDHDYSGFTAPIIWTRLGVVASDFEAHDLIRLPIKQTDKRAPAFQRLHGNDCAEVDAIPPGELRNRVQEAIEEHIDQKRWRRLQKVEQAEQESLAAVLDGWQRKGG